MPGPLKNNPKNTTGLKLGKAGGKRSRIESRLPVTHIVTGDHELDEYIRQLRKELERITLLVEQHEQKLNRMQVDAITHVVTFIA